MKKRILQIFLALLCLALVAAIAIPMVSSTAKASESIVPYVQDMVCHYRDHKDPDAKVIQESLVKIAEIDPKAGRAWEKIMESWHRCNTMEVPRNVLPDGLPEDDSLCIVTLGFALNEDGSMKPELVNRLKVALASAEKYPNAYVAVTGGGTASYTDDTEAEVMAQWLMEQGIDTDRIIVEK